MSKYCLLLLIALSPVACAAQDTSQKTTMESAGLMCNIPGGAPFTQTTKLFCQLDKTISPTGKAVKVVYNPKTKKFSPANVAKQVLKCQYLSGNFQIKISDNVWWQMNTEDAPLLPCIIQTS